MSANEPRSGRLSAKFDVGVNGAGLGVNGVVAASGFRFDASIARVLGDYEKRVSQGCEGGLTGGCIDEPPPSPPPPDGQLVKPKPGQAPAMLARAIEAAKRNPDAAAPFTPSPAPFTPTSNFAESRPERGSFAAMAAGY